LPLPEKGKRSYVYDSRENSLLIQVTSTGRKTFQVYRWHKTKPVRVTLGIFPDMTIEQARNKAQNIKAAL
jgi:hypothetical protein